MPENETQPDAVGEDVSQTVDGYMENHPLTTLLGDSARIRILIALLEAGEPLNPTRIVDQAGVDSKTTWYRNKDDLLRSGLVVESGQAGNSPLYRLATEDELPEGDDRADCLDKLADWTARALREDEAPT